MTVMPDEIRDYIYKLGADAEKAARRLATANTRQKNDALRAAAASLRARTADILSANAKDTDKARSDGKGEAFIDRLMLDEARINGIADAVDSIAELPDPVGRKLATFERPNGLKIERIAVPIGVIGMVFESRPNVGADAGALCLKSGNAVILRGGSESHHSTSEIVACMKSGLKAADLPEEAIQVVDTTDRAAVRHLLKCAEHIDLIIPRGGKGLVKLVVEEAAVPTLQHLDGNCHTYVHHAADIEKAIALIRNAKLRRTGVCGATESIVVDARIADELLPKLIDAMPDCEFRGDTAAQACDTHIVPASNKDWDTEYLDAILSVKITEELDEAIEFISQHSSAHTDAIVTEDLTAATTFLNAVDSAVVMHNASTQFSDGGEFGMGAEIGIATGKIHARGPVGLEQLTTFKYTVKGDGQTRS